MALITIEEMPSQEQPWSAYDEKAWKRQQIMTTLARRLLSKIGYISQFRHLPSPEAQQAFLARRLGPNVIS